VKNSELGLGTVEPISDVCRRNRLRWFKQVERLGDDDWMNRCTMLEVVGKRPRCEPRKTWMKTLKDDIHEKIYCSVPRGCEGQRFMEDENPWCKMADPG
jgi:hypothetical protein